jgi:hypothetical protein
MLKHRIAIMAKPFWAKAAHTVSLNQLEIHRRFKHRTQASHRQSSPAWK